MSIDLSTEPVTKQHFESADDFFDALRPRRRPVTYMTGGPGSPGSVIYRGLGDSNYRLVPKALREYDQPGAIRPNADDLVFLELRMLHHFVEACDRGGLAIPRDGDTFRTGIELNNVNAPFRAPRLWPLREHRELWAVAQHHGLPTRLLDWSKSPIVAAYFAAAAACTDRECKGDRIAVWAMSRAATLKERLEIVEVPAAHSPNLAAQMGLFTLTIETAPRGKPVSVATVDDIVRTTPPSHIPLLTMYTLPRGEAANLLELCELYGVSGVTMFPGLDGACRGAREKAARFDIQEKRVRDDLEVLVPDP